MCVVDLIDVMARIICSAQLGQNSPQTYQVFSRALPGLTHALTQTQIFLSLLAEKNADSVILLAPFLKGQ